jgi:hypothetical protein
MYLVSMDDPGYENTLARACFLYSSLALSSSSGLM